MYNDDIDDIFDFSCCSCWMEGLAKPGRLSRQGSRVRRHRSQEWQDYSSSDNEDHHQQIETSRPYRYAPATTEEDYDEQRTVESRKHSVGKFNLSIYASSEFVHKVGSTMSFPHIF